MKKAKFKIRKTSGGQYYFNFVGLNSIIVATSEMYNRRASAVKGIKAIVKSAKSAVIVDEQ